MKSLMILASLMAGTSAWAADNTGHTIQSANRDDQAFLGVGYDSKSQSFLSPCLQVSPANTVRVGVNGGHVDLHKVDSQAAVQKSLGFGAGMRARFGMYEASLSADFARSSSSNSYSSAVTFEASNNYKNAEIGQTRELTPVAKALFGSGPFASDAFIQTCGDEFVEQVELASKLLVSIKVEFSDSSEKQRFESRFNLKSSMMEASATLEQAQSEFHSTASITISAFQLGGRVERLATIFSAANGEAKTEANGVNALLKCSMTDLGACQTVIKQIMAYASDKSDPDAFPQQVVDSYDTTRPGGPAHVAYVTKPWAAANILVKPKLIASGVALARQDLENLFDAHLAYKLRVDGLMKVFFRLSDDQANRVQTYSDLLDDVFNDIFHVAITCYTDDMKCPDEVKSLKGRIENREKQVGFNIRLLEIEPETFAQWCDFVGFAGSETPPAALTDTYDSVKALVDYARSVMIDGTDEKRWNSIPDKCGHVADILSKQVWSVGIENRPFRDLRVLGGLKNLKVLTLRKAEITRLDGIESLTGLTRLELSDNSISDLTPLYGLTQLRALDLSRNHVSDVSGLKMLKQLQVLILHGNPEMESPVCPLSDPDGCLF